MALERQAGGKESVWRQHRLAIAGLAIALATVIAAFALLLSGDGMFSTELDVRYLIPSSSVAALLAIASLLKREGSWTLPAATLGLAAAALVLGWVVVVGLVVLGAGLLIALLSVLM